MAAYNTKQRKILTDFLAEHADMRLCSEDIYDALKASGISKSAVYRNIATLEEEGLVHRIAIEGTRKVYYQYTGAEKCRGELHLSCKKCGKTMHLGHETAENLLNAVAGTQDFIIDKSETVIYGTCASCQKNELAESVELAAEAEPEIKKDRCCKQTNKTKSIKIKSICIILCLCMFCGIFSALSNGCANKTDSDDEKLTIVTTIYPIYDWAKNICQGIENIEIIPLVTGGTDIHSYQPAMSDIAKIADCDVFIYIGGESDEAWVAKAAEYMKEDAVSIALIDYAKPLVEEVKEGMEAEDEDETSGEEGEEYDEHLWLSVKNAIIFTKAISDGIVASDKFKSLENEAVLSGIIEENTLSYTEKLTALDNEFTAKAANFKNKTIIFGDRFPFRYFVNDYGLDYYAPFLGCSTETNASFETIRTLSEKLSATQAKFVFVLKGNNKKIAETIISTAGVSCEILELNPLETATEDEIADENYSYISVMENNFELISKACE